ncbi:MAG: hypothetical protein ACQES2_04880 [Pseudomonadota bacterium]
MPQFHFAHSAQIQDFKSNSDHELLAELCDEIIDALRVVDMSPWEFDNLSDLIQECIDRWVPAAKSKASRTRTKNLLIFLHDQAKQALQPGEKHPSQDPEMQDLLCQCIDHLVPDGTAAPAEQATHKAPAIIDGEADPALESLEDYAVCWRAVGALMSDEPLDEQERDDVATLIRVIGQEYEMAKANLSQILKGKISETRTGGAQ